MCGLAFVSSGVPQYLCQVPALGSIEGFRLSQPAGS
jgi:hypothetical protein